MPQSDEKAKEYMAVLTEKSTKLARLVEDLIEASKLSSGNITLHPMVLDLGELTAQAIGEYQKEFEENRLQLVLDPDLPRVQAFADGSKPTGAGKSAAKCQEVFCRRLPGVCASV